MYKKVSGEVTNYCTIMQSLALILEGQNYQSCILKPNIKARGMAGLYPCGRLATAF